jgi:hypothetical protein
MRNHLTEFYTQIANNKIGVYGGMEPRDAAAAIKLAWDNIEQAIVFDFGDAEDLYNSIKLEQDYMMAPYPVVWCEVLLPSDDMKRGQFGLMIFNEKIDQMTKTISNWFCLFLKRKGTWRLFNFGSFDSAANYKMGNDSSYHNKLTMSVLAAYFRGLLALECTNVEIVENKPSKTRAMMNKGKAPLFSTWTLHIKMNREIQKNNLGGTHASPRVHLRRGHRRQYKPGKWTWINPCMVGDKKLGMVHKDYKLDDE